ncbi:MAG: class I SAM-dependent methyltransferase [Dehalococcoidia bacterium]
MKDRYSLEQIREYWTNQALEFGQQPAASWTDVYAIDLEIREILKFLSDGERVLDVGCANGYTAMQLASQRRVSIRGLDYVPEMIAQARARLADLESQLLGQVEFDVGDIMALEAPDEPYDRVVVVRVLINLGSWDNQRSALRQCARMLKPGGLLLLSEAVRQGWERLNRLRREWQLTDLPMPPFNAYLDEDQVAEAAAADFELVSADYFASTYFVGTRLLKPLLAGLLEPGTVNVADPLMEWNRWFSQMPAWGDYGAQKLFVFRKR